MACFKPTKGPAFPLTSSLFLALQLLRRAATYSLRKIPITAPQDATLTDLLDGKGVQLAQVTWIIPNGASSDHALANDGSGPSWIASIVNSIRNSPYCATCAL
jgi:hypothetical protein